MPCTDACGLQRSSTDERNVQLSNTTRRSLGHTLSGCHNAAVWVALMEGLYDMSGRRDVRWLVGCWCAALILAAGSLTDLQKMEHQSYMYI